MCLKLEAKRKPLRATKNWNFKPCRIRRAPLPLYYNGTPYPPGGDKTLTSIFISRASTFLVHMRDQFLSQHWQILPQISNI